MAYKETSNSLAGHSDVATHFQFLSPLPCILTALPVKLIVQGEMLLFNLQLHGMFIGRKVATGRSSTPML